MSVEQGREITTKHLRKALARRIKNLRKNLGKPPTLKKKIHQTKHIPI